jgi:hypothetical protein
MAKISKSSQELVFMQNWWVQAAMTLVYAGLTYAFASLAIDSGRLLDYVVTIAFAVFTVQSAARSARFLLNR